ncbi:MAG: methyltransferase domain-containing protein [Paracoccaceae bacterium]
MRARDHAKSLPKFREMRILRATPDIVSDLLSARSVLEIGSGSGINLMSLARLGTEAIGIEPVEAYRQMGAILAEVEGLQSIRSVAGAAERIPFESEKFDTVLCVSSHQYFDIQPALHEIFRVLKPGGEVVLISGSWSRYLFGQAHNLFAGFGPAKGYVMTVVNTAAYMVLGRRLIFRRQKLATAYPVYPSRRAMKRMLGLAGFELATPPKPVAGEVFFRARKPMQA